MSDPAWFPDPAGRHEHRWWDGERWSEVAADGGVEVSDPDGAAHANRVVAPAPDPYPQQAAPGVYPAQQAYGPGAYAGGAGAGGPGGPSPLAWVGLGLAAVVVAAGGVFAGRALAGGGDAQAGGEPVGRQDVIDIIDSGLYENFGGALDQGEAACAAEEVVDRVGHRQLIELGIGPENPYDAFSIVELSGDDQRDVAGGIFDCVSDGRLPAYLASQYSDGGTMTYDQGLCIADRQVTALGPTRLRELLVEGNLNPGATTASLAEGAEQDQLEAIDAECLAPDGTGTAPSG